MNQEILDRYQHQGAFSFLARAEPFTRIKQTQIDNLVVEYRERAEELRQKKPAAGGAPVVTGAPTGSAAPAAGPASAPNSTTPAPSAPNR